MHYNVHYFFIHNINFNIRVKLILLEYQICKQNKNNTKKRKKKKHMLNRGKVYYLQYSVFNNSKKCFIVM